MHFRLVRYVTLTSLAFFLIAGGALAYFYRSLSIDNMLRLQESSNVNLTRVFANNLWNSHFLPLLEETAATAAPDLGKNSRLQEIHHNTLELMRGSSTYKIKVYDLRGRTVYSSELKQIGEDKSANAGFVGAAAGTVKTELVHKEKFSAFENVVENRDLIQSYIPQYDPKTGKTVGVFEIYSDVTPFLAEISSTEQQLAAIVAAAFGALYLALFVIVRNAEKIIKTQHRERDLAQQQLAQSEKMASLGQLVAGVSHQLNTPIGFSLNNVTLAIDATRSFLLPLRVADRLAKLVRDTPPVERVILNMAEARPHVSGITVNEKDGEMIIEMLGDVLQGLEQMRELVENLLDFTRLDRAKVVDADINASLHTVIYVAKSAIPTCVQIIEEFGVLPAIECNPSQLNQVFLNLITNAAQAIPEKGTVTVRTMHERDHLRIEVIDTGTGIPADALPHIFDSYFTTKPKGVGTGLGLPIARDIVRSHGGDIRVETAEGKGTTFTIILPLVARTPTDN
jgi:two-component system NtrC family sensor kinase